MDDWTANINTVLCDLDGVVWLAHQPIPGSVEAVAALRASGRRVLFVTNNSAPTLSDHERALQAIGIDARGDIASSALAVTQLVGAGERVLVAAGAGVAEALEQYGVEVVVNTGQPIAGAVDAVVVGLHRDFDYERLAVAASAARSCGRLVGTNIDSTFPTPSGLLPGGGALLAAIASASGVDPVIAGKPHRPLADLVVSMLGSAGSPVDADRIMMVGDRLDTDGLFAQRLGCRFALVRSGVSHPTMPITESAGIDLDVADLAEVARRVIG
jgi:HAD superfamily hydrolase (TIGR01450 family)